MAAVYKALSKSANDKDDAPANGSGKPRNKQRVLILTSRGVTYRCGSFVKSHTCYDETDHRLLMIAFVIQASPPSQGFREHGMF